MNSKNIGYHTRLYADNTVKVVGGSFGGSVDADTVARLVKSHFTVIVKPSGTCVFVDKAGREVSLYVSVDARETGAGKEALKQHYAEQQKLWEKAQAEEQQASEEIDSLMGGLSHEEIVRRLKNK